MAITVYLGVWPYSRSNHIDSVHVGLVFRAILFSGKTSDIIKLYTKYKQQRLILTGNQITIFFIIGISNFALI